MHCKTITHCISFKLNKELTLPFIILFLYLITSFNFVTHVQYIITIILQDCHSYYSYYNTNSTFITIILLQYIMLLFCLQTHVYKFPPVWNSNCTLLKFETKNNSLEVNFLLLHLFCSLCLWCLAWPSGRHTIMPSLQHVLHLSSSQSHLQVESPLEMV